MTIKTSYAAIDGFRMVAAVLVVAIHTSPLALFGDVFDDSLTYTLGRIAVPFFLATTGFFILGSFTRGSLLKSPSFRSQLKKLCILYGIASLLYLPLMWYSGNLPDSVASFFQMLFFDGTFYHLWYFPATIIGCVIVAALLDRFGPTVTVIVSLVLYAVGILGDSYFGLASQVSVLAWMYDVIFSVSEYTRNGIFYVPIFLSLGALIRNSDSADIGRKTSIIALLLSLCVLFLEGSTVHAMGIDRHDSMYVSLIPVTYFLFIVLRDTKIKGDFSWARDVSLWIYILHPLCIVGIRGLSKITGTADVVIGNSLAFFVAVCVASIALAGCFYKGKTLLARHHTTSDKVVPAMGGIKKRTP